MVIPNLCSCPKQAGTKEHMHAGYGLGVEGVLTPTWSLTEEEVGFSVIRTLRYRKYVQMLGLDPQASRVPETQNRWCSTHTVRNTVSWQI